METKRLIEYIKGNTTEKDRIEVMDWVEADEKNMKEFLAQRKLYDIYIWNENTFDQPTKHTNKKNINIRRLGISFLKIASVFILSFILVRYFVPFPENQISGDLNTIQIPTGQRAQVSLSDGTHVWLNSLSKLSFQENFSGKTRKVFLDGEGYFDVAKNKDKPFIVNINGYEIKVLGTVFNVIAYSSENQMKISLLEGSVELLDEKGSSLVTLKPNEEILLDKKEWHLQEIEHPEQFQWREGLLIFDNQSFDEIIKQLERVYDIKINIENKELLGYQYNAKFRANDGFMHIMKVLQLSNPFNYEYNNNTRLLTIK